MMAPWIRRRKVHKDQSGAVIVLALAFLVVIW